ncbi:MAG TPA: alpha/beta hydrolase [Methylibium sp.]|nr:alpha/beta hydrolase [Methylibium sp.]
MHTLTDSPSRGTVVLLHASASSARQWQALADALAPHWQVHAIDFHGHGARPDRGTDAAPTLDADAALVAPLLGRGAHLVGHSYGAAIALKLAHQQPQRVRSVLAYEPVLFGLLRDDPAALRETSAVAAAMRERLAAGDALAAGKRFIDHWSGDGAWAALPAARQHGSAARMATIARQFDALYGEPLAAADLARLPMPLLLLNGSRTLPVARRIVDAVLAARPRSGHAVLPGLGHMGPITHADAFNRRVLAFLQSQTFTERLQAPDSPVRESLVPAL